MQRIFWIEGNGRRVRFVTSSTRDITAEQIMVRETRCIRGRVETVVDPWSGAFKTGVWVYSKEEYRHMPDIKRRRDALRRHERLVEEYGGQV